MLRKINLTNFTYYIVKTVEYGKGRINVKCKTCFIALFYPLPQYCAN